MVEPVGIDIGFRITKANAGRTGAEYIGPSAVAAAPPFAMGGSQVTPNYSDHTGSYLVGEAAVNFGEVEYGSVDSSYFTENRTFRVLGLHALGQVVGEGEVDLVVGLPMEFFARLRGRVQKELETWKDNRIRVRKVRVVPQPIGTMYDVTRTWKGKRREEQSSRRSAVVDIGGGTTDCIQLYDGQPTTNGHMGWSRGVSQMHETLRERINRAHRRQYTVDPAEVPGIFEDGGLWLRGEWHDYGETIRKIKKDFVEQLADSILDGWPKGTARLNPIIFTGGGAEALREQLAEPPSRLCAPAQVRIPDDAGRSNARGFAKIAWHASQAGEPA